VVARTRPESHALVVTFSRDGEEPEEMFASDGQRAWRNAITLIAKREWLLSGDTLTVRRTHGSPGAAPHCLRRASLHRFGGCEPSRGNLILRFSEGVGMQESLPSFTSIKPPGDANSPHASAAGPLVSVVIPTHNRPDLLRIGCHSARAQNCPERRAVGRLAALARRM